MTVYSPNATSLERANALSTLFKTNDEEIFLYGARWAVLRDKNVLAVVIDRGD